MRPSRHPPPHHDEGGLSTAAVAVVGRRGWAVGSGWFAGTGAAWRVRPDRTGASATGGAAGPARPADGRGGGGAEPVGGPTGGVFGGAGLCAADPTAPGLGEGPVGHPPQGMRSGCRRHAVDVE
ncbi:hypothetical protein GCM10017674_28750 [Streptomyces gardneri]|uniref:Uncharacterized protein n=1 Tax=Streptomyces gardneri TaxID=66892 RepID=A0A4Y3RCI7_9ACTN|nr:hypothetical protein SGA01_07990 [Streptomyces gardneri]GHG96483.1 hypothetical protein GCM10017674_28750 [Streptomyces gardneri]